MKIKEAERKYLTRLLGAELHEKNNRQLHAASHGSDFYDPDLQHAENLLDRLEGEETYEVVDA